MIRNPGTAFPRSDKPPKRENQSAKAPSGTERVLAVAALTAVPSAVPRLRQLARAVARGHRLLQAAEEALTVIASELAANVVLHSGSTDMTVVFATDGTTLSVTVRDRGQWRERPLPRCEAADMNADFGRGFALVDAYSVETSVRPSAEGSLVRVVIAL
jgi:anti-sigma regulatory factor (Ser/Thr protein kinase)